MNFAFAVAIERKICGYRLPGLGGKIMSAIFQAIVLTKMSSMELQISLGL